MQTVIGIEIGQQEVFIGQLSSEGKCLKQESASKPADEAMQTMQLIAMIERFKREVDWKTVKAIGISALSHVTYGNAVAELGKTFKLPCSLTHIGNAAALAERRFGQAKDMENFVSIALEADLQCGIVVNGQLAIGEHHLAGGLGHTLVHVDGDYDRLKKYISANGIKMEAWRMMAENPQLSTPLHAFNFHTLTAEAVIEAARAKDKLATMVFERLGYIFGLKLSDVINYFSPRVFILNSSLAGAADLLIKHAYFHMEKNTFPIFQGKISIIPSEIHAESAPIIRAGAVALGN